MKKEFLQSKTNAYFSVQSITDFRKDIDKSPGQKWFSILVLSDVNGEIDIDDTRLELNEPQAVFITPGQHVYIPDNNHMDGYVISFNKEFYCIEFHDADVSCQGLLFVNNFTLVHFELDEQQLTIYLNSVKEMIHEIESEASLHDEMLKNILKNLLIRSNRLFRARISTGNVDDTNIDFVRKFSDLVEKNFKENKQVESYAGMLNIASATLTKKLQKYGIDSPSKIIKARVITEAKRLLLYTDKSIKEIASFLGFDDQFYFSRLFTKETGLSPKEYKKNLNKM